MALDRIFIEAKLRPIGVYEKRLQTLLDHTDQEIIKKFELFHALERLIQLIVDEMIDINTHIIRRMPFHAPDDFQGTFLILAEHSILPQRFADRLAPIVGLRNRLVHRYEEIDKTILIH